MKTDHNSVFPIGEPDPYRIAYLIAGYIHSNLDDEERDELDEWVVGSDENMRLFGELTDEKNIAASLKKLRSINPDIAFAALQERIKKEEQQRGRSFSVKAVLAVAASLVLLLVAYYVFRTQQNNYKQTEHQYIAADDIAPGGAHATLTVAGKVTDLETVAKGNWLTSDAAGVEKAGDGLIQYTPGAVLQTRVEHILTTPKGGEFSVVLEDGTRVWLNAASQLIYPAHFSGPQRMVQLKGEAYFEVNTLKEDNIKKPFIVQVGEVTLTVTGTRFNVNAYENEPRLTTTLLEGSVNLETSSGASRTLAAGDQARYASNQVEMERLRSTDGVIAWKNGLFKFENADIRSIMREVERWYNAQVVYKGEVNERFNATVERSVPASKLLRYLELTGRVRFEIKDKTITVYPQ